MEPGENNNRPQHSQDTPLNLVEKQSHAGDIQHEEATKDSFSGQNTYLDTEVDNAALIYKRLKLVTCEIERIMEHLQNINDQNIYRT